ncbi:SspB-related isopeptide-forming adhesin [Streptococcus uberis]|uniref:SspB-related isopeptide-forming adhesin n=1 Tax=Streptococcus uberis TaxID=1349 RepID=UPI003D6C2B47
MTLKKETFGFRKAKNVTTIGGTRVGSKDMLKGAVVAGTIAVLPFVTGGHSVNADEVTTPTQPDSTAVATNPNPATNLVPVQPEATQGNTEAVADAGTGSSTTTTTIEKPAELTQAENSAKSAGVTITDGGTEKVADAKTAESNYATETKIVQDTTAQAIADQKAYEAKKAEVDAKNAETKAKEDALKANNIASDSTSGIYVTGAFDPQATGLDFYKNIKVVATTEGSHDVESLGWNANTSITSSSGVTVSPYDPNKTGQWKIGGTTSEFLYRIDGITKGDSIFIKNWGTTSDGININAKLVFTDDTKLVEGDQFALIGKTEDNGIAWDYWNFKDFGFDGTFLDDEGNPIKLTIASIIGDVDNGQKSTISFGGNTLNYVNPDGSHLTDDGSGLVSKELELVNGYQNAPVGTYLAVGTSSKFSYTHTSDKYVLTSKDTISNYIEFDLFGTSSKVETETFTYLPQPVAPTKKTVAVKTYQVDLKTGISKTVSNDSGENVDGLMVPKGSEAPYTLKTNALEAGRPLLANGSYVITDHLPSGYLVNVEKTVAQNSAFNVAYDEASNTITFMLKDSEVAKLNADRTKAFNVVDPIIYGNPQNDNATYINAYNFKAGNLYDMTSNTVTIYTPGTPDPNDPHHGNSIIQPTKQVLDTEGNDINNKTVKAGQDIVYVGKWDLDQYKGIMAGAVAISKGFGYIDNYDEAKEILNVEGTTIKNRKGETVNGLTPYVIKNLADAPQAIKDLVKQSGVPIEDNDEFVIWVADDYQGFFDKYVKVGDSIFFTMPAKIKDTVKDGESVDNIVYQIDFGNGYAGNWVHNTVENPKVPETPKTPASPKVDEKTPIAQASVLPTTGEQSTGWLGAIGMAIVSVVSLFGIGKIKKVSEK